MGGELRLYGLKDPIHIHKTKVKNTTTRVSVHFMQAGHYVKRTHTKHPSQGQTLTKMAD